MIKKIKKWISNIKNILSYKRITNADPQYNKIEDAMEDLQESINKRKSRAVTEFERHMKEYEDMMKHSVYSSPYSPHKSKPKSKPKEKVKTGVTSETIKSDVIVIKADTYEVIKTDIYELNLNKIIFNRENGKKVITHYELIFIKNDKSAMFEYTSETDAIDGYNFYADILKSRQ